MNEKSEKCLNTTIVCSIELKLWRTISLGVDCVDASALRPTIRRTADRSMTDFP